MFPLLVVTAVAQFVAYLTTQHQSWLLSGLLILAMGPYTMFVLLEDIATLRKSNATEVEATTKRFCKLHHVRLVLSVAGFGLALVALAEM